MFNKILLCTDGSAPSLKAAAATAEIAQKFGSTVVLLNVYDPCVVPAATIGIPGGSLETAASMGCYVEETQAGIEKETGAVLQQAGVRFTLHRELGHPVDRIVCVAQDDQADLIVLGSRGHGGYDRLLIGSVSEGVLRHAHTPVLIVR